MTNLSDFRTSKTFSDLTTARRNWGFDTYGITVRGQKVDKAIFLDTSWEGVEEIADAVVYLRFEITKLTSKGLLREKKRLENLVLVLTRVGNELFQYRKRLETLSPDLLQASEVTK